MTDIVQITDTQKLKLELLTLVSNDATAFKKASEFVGNDMLRFELFRTCYAQAHMQPTPVAKAEEAVTEAEQRLAIMGA